MAAMINNTNAIMPALPSQRDMVQRLEDFRNFDKVRQSEIEFYINACLRLNHERATLESDLDDERNMKRAWKKRAEDAEAAVARKFAVVLVDGDGYIFRRAFFDAITTFGGSKAANELYNEIIKNLKDANGINPHCDVLVNIYANKQGLAKALAGAGYLSHPHHLDQFFCSFTQGRSLFQFIDCGYGKERVDAKLRDTFSFYAYNAQCQRIYLACTHDSGYIAEFDKYSHDSIADKIMLVHGAQTPGTARQYDRLPFKSTRFDTVFESSLLETSPKLDAAYVPTAPNDLNLAYLSENGGLDLTPAISRSSSSSNSVPLNPRANAFPQPTPPPAETASAPLPNQSLPEAINGTLSVKNGIPVNRFGQRIDLKMRIPTAAETEKFEKRIAIRKLCNEHHLRDNCESWNCKYDHQAIDATMLNTLRHKARSIPCTERSKCRRLDCFYGHQCPWGSTSCDNPKCSFIKAGLHDIKEEFSKRVAPAPI